MKSITSLIIVFLFGIFVFSAHAAMHKWVDEKGRTWITDYPGPKDAKKKGHEAANPAGQTQSDESARPPTREADQVDQKRDIGKFLPLPEGLRKQINAFSQVNVISFVLGPMLAMMSGFMIFIALAGYIYFSLCLYFIARKTFVPNPWLAWIPLVNMWTFVLAAGKEWWWLAIIVVALALTMLPIAGIIFYLVSLGIIIYLWMCITENMGRNKWLGLLMMVPLVNLIFPAILAFSKVEGHSYPSDMTVDQS